MGIVRARYVNGGTLRLLGQALTALGVFAVLAGPIYLINGLTQARGAVRVPVAVLPGPEGETVVYLPVAGLPDEAFVAVQGRIGELSALDSTMLEQFLGRADDALVGLAVGCAVWLLRPVIASLSAGNAFGAGNARRLYGLGVLTAVVTLVAPMFPVGAATLVLHRIGVETSGPDALLQPQLDVRAEWLVAAVVLVVLAEAFRQGERLHEDTEGLV